MKSGKLSFEEDESGNRVIDASELMRVYGDACDFDRADETGRSVQHDSAEQPVNIQLELAREKIEGLEEKVDLFKDEVDYLRERLTKSDERAGDFARLTKLLTDGREHKSEQVSVQDKKLEDLDRTIAELKQQHTRVLRELKAEKSKSLWRRIVG